MKAMLVLFSLVISVSGFAKNSEIYTFKGKRKEIINVPERRLSLSKTCWNKKNDLNCLAFEAFQRAPAVKSSREYPPDIAKDICLKSGGKIVVGLTLKKDQAPFCYFQKDDSFIDVASLFASNQHMSR